MSYRQRIEKAVRDMFNCDRAIMEDIEILTERGWEVLPNWPSCADIACDLLNVPEDNSCDYDYNGAQWAGDECPEKAFCRDHYYDLWLRDAETADEFIDFCRGAIKEFAQKNMIFTKPGYPEGPWAIIENKEVSDDTAKEIH